MAEVVVLVSNRHLVQMLLQVVLVVVVTGDQIMELLVISKQEQAVLLQ